MPLVEIMELHEAAVELVRSALRQLEGAQQLPSGFDAYVLHGATKRGVVSTLELAIAQLADTTGATWGDSVQSPDEQLALRSSRWEILPAGRQALEDAGDAV